LDSEEKFTDIRQKLQNLEKIRTGEDFVKNLQLKIVEHEAEKRREHAKKYDESRGGFLKNLFTPRQYPWLIPAAGFTVLLFFVFYITYVNRNVSEKNIQSKANDSAKNEISQSIPKSGIEKVEPPVPGDRMTDGGVNVPEKTPEKKDKDIAAIEQDKESRRNESKTRVESFDDHNQKLEAAPKQRNEDSNSDDTKDDSNSDETKDDKKTESAIIKSENQRGAMKPQEESAVREMDSGDTVRKKIDLKIGIIDKTKLEEIREKIQNSGKR